MRREQVGRARVAVDGLRHVEVCVGEDEGVLEGCGLMVAGLGVGFGFRDEGFGMRVAG